MAPFVGGIPFSIFTASITHTRRTQGTPPRQAYNAQAAVNDRQVILAAEISISTRPLVGGSESWGEGRRPAVSRSVMAPKVGGDPRAQGAEENKKTALRQATRW